MAEVLAQAAPARGPAPDDRHQRRRPRRARHRRPDRGGGELAPLARRDDRGARRASCPPHWSHGNPIDVLGDAGPDRYARRWRSRPGTRTPTACWSILTPQAMTDPTQTAERLQGPTPGSRASRCWPAGWAAPTSRPARRSCRRPASRPSPSPTPPPAPSTHMWRYSHNSGPSTRRRAGRGCADGRAPTAPRPGR